MYHLPAGQPGAAPSISSLSFLNWKTEVTLLYLSMGFSSGQERRGRRRNGIQRKILELERQGEEPRDRPLVWVAGEM